MSQGLRMVHLRTVPDGWHAKVLAARLGCEGIVTHLQGNVSGPYPFGAVSVLVEEDQAELAAALLLADEVEAAFSERQRNCLDAGAGPLLLLTGDDDILAGPDDGGRPDLPALGLAVAARRRRRGRPAGRRGAGGGPLHRPIKSYRRGHPKA